MKEYRIAKGWAVVVYLAVVFLITLFGWLLIMPFVSGFEVDDPQAYFLFTCPFAIAMIALSVMGLVEIRKGKFVIDEKSLKSVSVLSTRELAFDEIRGYRADDKYIYIEPAEPKKKRVKVSLYLANTGEITEWLAARYPDLDVAKALEEEKEILANPELGFSEERRETALKSARTKAKYLNVAAACIGAWGFFAPTPYEYVTIALLVLPLIALFAIKFSNGLIRFDDKKDSAYPSAVYAMAVGIVLGLRAILDFSIFDYSKVWLPTAMITAAFLFVLMIGNKEFSYKKAKDYLSLVGAVIILAFYSYGVLISLNCVFDSSKPEIFTASVLSKRVSSGKTTTYYLELAPWGPQEKVEEISVDEVVYDRVDEGENVNVYFKKGTLDIPWVVVSD
jgi:hypothetical protein